ncbi:MAG TPA: glycosyltransferase family 2 protein [Puia sp.]|nr:glycosyltransferase family 2 protein [Puia sp.]
MTNDRTAKPYRPIYSSTAGRPEFSVVIPTYNRAEKLLRGLTSLNNQSFVDFEVLVCDDGSTDDTRSVVDHFRPGIRFRELRYFYSPNWGGPARPRNTGIREASAEWICFLDSDDIWHPRKLEKTVACRDKYDLIYHAFDLRTATGKLTPLTARSLKKPVFRDLMLNGHNGCIINSGVCVRKTMLQLAGGFSEDPALIGVEDADCWLKISRMTDAFKYIPDRLGTYYLDGGNITVYNRTLFDKLLFLFDSHSPFLGDASAITRAGRTNAYHLGRIMHIMGNIREARGLYFSALRSPNPRLVIRALAWILFIYCKQKKLFGHEL